MDSLPTNLLLQVILIFLNAIFAASEIAVISLNDMKLQKLESEGNKRAMRLGKLTAEPTNFLGTIQVGITLAGFLGSAFAADNFSEYLVNFLVSLGVTLPVGVLDTIAVIVITLILSFFTLVFGELVPKRIAMKKAEKLSMLMANFLYGISKVCAPVVWLLTRSTNLVLRLFGINPQDEDEEVTEEEIRMMIDVGSQKGTIDPEETEMIHNVFEFDDKDAQDVMLHRTDVEILWMEDSVEEWEDTIAGSTHTRYPVCADTVDTIVGILNTRDFYRALRKGKIEDRKSLLRPAFLVPESIKADDLFRKMQKAKEKFAIVLDEYGGMSGIVTMEDLIEEIVGNLWEDEEVEEEEIQKTDDNTWIISGSAELDRVADDLDVKLPLEEYHTFAGMILGLLGSIPEDGTTPELEAYGLQMRVLNIEDHRIERVHVCRIEPEKNK